MNTNQIYTKGSNLYDTVLFDLDGTLTNPKKGITKSVQYALSAFGITSKPDELVSFIGPPLRDSFKQSYKMTQKDIEKAITKYREYYTAKGIFDNKLYAGVVDMIEKLKMNNKTLILATSKPTVFANQILKHFELDKYFDFVSGSELDGSRDAKAEVIDHALKSMNLKPTQSMVMVGDRKHDIIGAKAHRLKSIGVLYGYGSKQELQNAGADIIVNSIEELKNMLVLSS